MAGRKNRHVGCVRLKQDATAGVTHDVGEELVMLADGAKPLRDPILFILFAPDDVHDGQRQQALRSFLQRGVEDFVHLTPQDQSRHGGGSDLQHGQQNAKEQSEPGLKARGPPHGLPKR